MKQKLTARLLSVLLVLSLLCGFAVPVQGAGSAPADTEELSFQQVDNAVSPETLNGVADEEAEEPAYADTDVVRVSIILEKKSTIEAGFSTQSIADNSAAMSYRDSLKADQAAVTARIEEATSKDLDVVWNLTLAANIISANVPYGEIEQILDVPGVADVVVETQYEPCVASVGEDDPNMSTSCELIGSNEAWAAGYTGAGSRIAVIDTGIDPNHQSFSALGLNYSLAYRAGLKGVTVEEYTASLDLLDVEEIESVKDQLNANIDPSRAYMSTKIPYAYSYIDNNYVIDHSNVSGGSAEHGSHVEGIAAANAFIPNGDGTFSNALDTVKVQGVAPDAQILTMKVFGAGGGAYDSDYMVAIEDAIILGADSVNLSLGSGSPGFSRNSTAAYQAIMENLAESGTVVTMSGSNSYGWSTNAQPIGYLYADDVSMDTVGSPSSFVNSLSVASVDNSGFTGQYLQVGDDLVFYTQTSYTNEPFSTLSGEREYILIDGFGTDADFAAIANVLAGKIAVCSRGGVSFYQKAEAAVKYGAIATIVYNNTTGTINMDLSSYTKTAPCVSITQADGAVMRANATPVTDDEGNILYYAGTLTVSDGIGSVNYDLDYYTMSAFSSYGVPGSLILKPEITAPGGNIYSVNGLASGNGVSYESMSGTSMASPQVAGMAALIAQYVRENGLEEKLGMSARQIANSLLMSTAEPMFEEESGGNYWTILRQGSGIANVGSAISAESYIKMDEAATASASDGKVKAELGDDPQRTGSYSFSFSVNNITDEALNYTLDADFFTQDIFMYEGKLFMDTWTTTLPANVTYTVDGVPFVPVPQVSCDLDEDGDTDADDAQIVLNYVAGLVDTIDEIADVDGDGDVTTKDAYLILDSMEVREITVAAGASVSITVEISLPASVKEFLNTYYEGGAYVEGFVYVKPTTTQEGVQGVTHSIPVLGFYGSWTDASMFDKLSYTDYLYGDTTVPYTGVVATNNLTVKYQGDPNTYYQIGNPYIIEDTYPEGRAAINSADTIYQYKITLIRNAAALTMLVTDEEGKVLTMGSVSNQATSAYYYVNGGAWQNTSATYTFNKKVNTLGVKEGDVINVSLVAIPEYYENGAALTAEEVTELIESGALGEGAFLTTTMTVDDTAPVVTGITKDLLTGNLTVTASDNNYIASVQVLNKGGSLYAQALPEATEKGQTTSTVVDLSGASVGPECIIAVCDYAGNVTAYKVAYGGEPEDYTGRMFGFTSSPIRGSGQRWVEIDPAHVYYYNTTTHEGMTDVATTDLEVYAAEYVDGYVFFATDTGFYAANQGEWTDYQKVASFPEGVAAVRDMAFNYQNGKLYFLDSANTVYTLNLTTGAAEKIATISITNPRSTSTNYKALTAMTIDDEGNFYAVNYGSSSYVYLYSWTLDDVVDGAITDLAPVFNTTTGYLAVSGLYSQNFQSLAWDHDKDILYFGAGYGTKSNSDLDNELWVIDVTTGKAGRASDYAGGYSSAYVGRFQAHVVGLYIVPSASQAVKPTDTATSIELNKTEMTLLTGSEFQLTADVYPWILRDKSVTWESSNPEIVSVENGLINTLAVGEAVITATTVAEPHLTATCTVTVEKLDNVKLSGLVYDVDGSTHWSEFETDDLTAWTAVADGGPYYAGTLHEGELLVHNGSTMLGIDPDTFETTSYGTIASSWIWSDAAECPAEDDLFGRMVGLCNGGTMMEMLNPAEGTLSYWDLSTYFADDPMATIAYAGSGTYDYVYIIYEYPDCPARFYYMMTESGKLYKLTVFTYTEGSSYTIVREEIGDTGIDLNGVSAVTGGTYASMVYDETTGYLLISSYQEGDTAQLYAVSPDSLIPAVIGQFGENIWPVVSLYQYDRATDLTLRLNTTALNLYVDDTATIGAKVILGTTNELTWTTSDDTVAAVDANGTVTAVGEGSATITATTVAVNAADEHVSADVTVNVKPLTALSGTATALVTTESGSAWVDIDLSTKTTTVKKADATSMTGGGYGTDAIYTSDVDLGGTVNGNIYKINATTFAESQGSGCSSSYAPLDVTDAPATTFTFTENGTVYTADAFGYPFYIANVGASLFLLDYEEGTLTGWNTQNYYSDLAAIAYIGSFEQKEGNASYGYDAGTIAHEYLALSADGSLYIFQITPGYDPTAEEGDEVGYILSRGTFGNIGMEFDDNTALSMDYVEFSEDCYGLLIADSTTGSLYFADLSGEEITCGKVGNISGITGITALHNAQPASTNTANEKFIIRAGDDVTASSAVSMGVDLPEIEVAVNAAMAGNANADQVGGSTNAISGQLIRREPVASIQETGATAADGTVTLTISEDQTVTNGLVKVTYDPTVLTYASTGTLIANYAVNVDAATGTILFDYATAKAIAAGTTLATINFTYEAGYIDTTVTVETLERNSELGITGESVEFTLTYEVGGDHDYQVTESVEPTCLEAGYKIYTCTKCNDSYREDLEPLGHDWSDWATVTDATCTEDGSETRSCQRCGVSETRVIPAKGHSFSKTTVEPTCTNEGYDLYVCVDCGYSYRDNFVSATGHSYVATVTAPTCESQGYTTYTCSACGDSYVSDYVAATGHTWGDWVVTKAPTCNAAGEKTRTCSVCGETETEVVLPTGHTFESEVVAPTCTESGYTLHTCTLCGQTYITDVTNPLGHDWSEWTVEKAPTCTEPGTEIRTCARCDETETRTVPAVGHDYEEKVVAPTCTEPGYTVHTCSVCGDSYFTDLVPAIGHEWGEWTVTKAGTCTEDGVETRTCKHCDAAETRTIAATGHSWGEWVVTVEADCFHDGEEARFCANCDEKETKVIPANGDNCPSKAFSDLDTSRWYHEGVDFVLTEGIMVGITDTIFAPNAELTRGQIVTILYRMAGSPEMDVETPFTDVDPDRFYAAAVAWAFENGIVKGVSDTEFAPSANVTREQLVTFLARYATFKGVDVTAEGNLDAFADSASVSKYAVDSMIWAVENGIVAGMEGNTLAPKATASRAQVATFVLRFCTKFGK